MFVPAKTPREMVERLHDETLKALQSIKVKDKLASLGVDPMVMTPAEFQALVEKEIHLNAVLAKSAGLGQ
jgi:tripartite-type tricarboxylate transporter receptor subunit TctC